MTGSKTATVETLTAEVRVLESIALLAAAADLMHDIGQFWVQAHGLARSRLERLFGLPIRPGGHWREQPPDIRRAALRADREAFARHLRAMPGSTMQAWERATGRLEREYGPRGEACARVWRPVYEYLVRHHLSDVGPEPSKPNALCLPPGTGPGRSAA